MANKHLKDNVKMVLTIPKRAQSEFAKHMAEVYQKEGYTVKFLGSGSSQRKAEHKQ
jgi:hypothetical protein